MSYTYTNRMGRTYTLHRRETKRGVRYVFARKPGEGAIDEIPEGYEVRENVNGLVSLGKTRRISITQDEAQSVRSVLEKHDLEDHRVEVDPRAIIVYEPDRPSAAVDEILRFLGPYGQGPRARDVLTKNMTFSPVLKFEIVDEQTREFYMYRMTYRGEGGWSWPLDQGPLANLAEQYVPHLGQDSFYELV